MSTTWDPQQYLRYAEERARPFEDLIARTGVESPAVVVDLGCGPGNLTVTLSDRWPSAHIVGIDSSEEMIVRAGDLSRPGRLEFRAGDLTSWRPERPVDVVVCNAALHWVPGHLGLLPGLVASLSPGGVFAFQVPANFGLPSHVLLRELSLSERWREILGPAVENGPSAHEPSEYLEVLLDSPRADRVEVWETTYHHVLSGPDPVLDWVKATGLRPVLEALRAWEKEDHAGAEREFLSAYAAVLRAAYPRDTAGRTIFPFRRIFGVVQVSRDPDCGRRQPR